MHTNLDQPAIGRHEARFDFSDMRVHMIGIGGAGMSGAAAMLLDMGASITGSDLSPFDGLGKLVNSGAKVAVGKQDGQLPPDTDLVVISAAIPESNPELAAARRRNVKVVKYAELLGALMMRRCGVAVAGTHGKTTTTAMCAHLFRGAGFDPSFIFGGSSKQLGGNSGVGSGPHFIVESCEFDRSFLHLHPHLAVILNIEADHLDCYGTFDAIVEAFGRFAEQVDPNGVLLYGAEDPCSVRAASHTPARAESVGFDNGADWCASDLRRTRGQYAFDVHYHGTKLLTTRLGVPGRHNVSNALAAIALAHHAGADPERLAQTLPDFEGVGRRLTWRGAGRGVTIIDDYAHHPTEIRVTVEAAVHRYEPKRTWVVFQPHQSARTTHLMDDFAASFGQVDQIIIPDIFGAREGDPDAERAGAQELVSRICGNGGHARYVASLDAAADHVAQHVADGDLVLTMGAGDVWKVADVLVERFC